MSIDYLWRLLDTSDFPPRWRCGIWSSGHGWLHILSDLGIWAAYFTIPFMLWFMASRGKTRFRGQFLLFALFIFFCGATHLMEAAIFWWPAYRLAGLIKIMTAIVSWATVFSLIRIAPVAMRMRTHEELETEVSARKLAESELQELNAQLEERVQTRVLELAAANAQLHQQREWFRTTLASIGDAVISTDSAGHITMLNDVAIELTGWTLETANGRPLETVFNIVHESTRQPVHNPARQALAERRIVGLANHTILISKDQTERPIADSAAPIRDAHGEITGAVLVFRDITETRRLEDQNRQSQKMEAIGRFAGGIAHDFNNLLTVINGYCQLIESEGQLNTTGRDYLNEVCLAGKRAANLTQQLLAFGRMQLVQPKVIDLNEVVVSTHRMLKRLIGEDVIITLRLADELWPLRADVSQVEQILVNLAVNARDAMPKGGSIEVETRNQTITPANSASLENTPPGDFVMLAFRDTGTGMEESVRQRAFEPYFTTKELGKGTGLGLATVFGIVKQNQGHITLTSKPGSGTLFRIFLPREMAEIDKVVSSNMAPLRSGNSETILVVDDDEAVHDLTCHILRSAGYHVLQARNGRDAENLFQQHAGQINLVISDIVMPEMSGRQLQENLKARQPDLKVLLISGYTNDESLGLLSPSPPSRTTLTRLDDTNDPTNYHAHDHDKDMKDELMLAKPFSTEMLLRKVRDLLDGQA